MQLITYSKAYRPKKAGLAKLHFDRDIYSPEREGDVIYLPDSEGSIFFEHKVNPTFLYIEDDNSVYFGGTDERPFLVELSTSRIDTLKWIQLWQEGKFEETLKPHLLEALSKIFKKEPKRQGDIWALPLTTSDWKLFLSLGYLFEASLALEPKKVKDYSVYGTRHVLEGEYCRFRRGLAAQGVISAPDHTELDISKTLHLIFQNDHLRDPARAD